MTALPLGRAPNGMADSGKLLSADPSHFSLLFNNVLTLGRTPPWDRRLEVKLGSTTVFRFCLVFITVLLLGRAPTRVIDSGELGCDDRFPLAFWFSLLC